MIIYKRGVHADDHLQEAGLSGWSFARGRSIGKIVIHAQDLRILKSLGFEDPYILRIIGSSNPLDVYSDKWIIS